MVSIRQAEAADFSEIHKIFTHAVETGTGSFNLTPPSFDSFSERMTRLLSETAPFFIATDDSTVLGYAWADWFRPRPGYRFTLENSVYVSDHAQGNGIGKTLLKQVLVDAHQKGFKQMIAVIGDSENIPSIRLHEACGFEKAGMLKHVGFKFDRWLDSVYMQKEL